MSDNEKRHHIYVQHCYHGVVKRCPAGTLAEKFGDRPVAVITTGRGYGLAVSREGLSGPWWYAGNVLRLSSGWAEKFKDDITYCLRPEIEDIPFESVKLTSDEFYGLALAGYFRTTKHERCTVRAIGGDTCGEWKFQHEKLPEAAYITAGHSYMEPLVKEGLVELKIDKKGRECYGLTDLGREEREKDGIR